MAAAGFKFRKIRYEPTLGQKLLKARKRLKLSLENVESQTKVRVKYLEALESGDYRALPSNVYVKGFLQSYAKVLGLKFDDLYLEYQKERQSFSGLDELSFIDDSSNKINKQPIIITSKALIWPTIALSVLLIIGYVFYQIFGFASAPKLDVVTPSKDLIISATEQLFEGSTDPGASLKINDQSITVGEDGHFNQTVKLLRGLNTVELLARNKNQKETKKIFLIEVRDQTALK